MGSKIDSKMAAIIVGLVVIAAGVILYLRMNSGDTNSARGAYDVPKVETKAGPNSMPPPPVPSSAGGPGGGGR